MIPAPTPAGVVKWPKDTEADLIAFYGEPKSAELESQLVDVIPPFRMTFQGVPVHSIKFHRKAAAALQAALEDIWESYGKDQAAIDRARISVYDGAYNPRKIAGSDRWSNHAFAAAIDFDAEHNGFNTGHGTMPDKVVAAFKRVGARWGGDYHGRTDPMHFEFCGEGVFNPLASRTDPIPIPIPSTPTPDVSVLPPTLQYGSRGEDVKRLQRIIMVDGIFGKATEEAVKEFQRGADLEVDGICGPETWSKLLQTTPHLQPVEPVEPDQATPQWNRDIVATVFGGAGDVERSAYTGEVLREDDLYVALPFRFVGERPRVLVVNRVTGKSCEAPNEDVGPWNTTDPYWEKGRRPQAESGEDMRGRKTNLAGIDLSPALAKAIGVDGKGKVDWCFVTAGQSTKPTTEASKNKPPVVTQPRPTPPDWKDFDIWGWFVSLFKRK